MKKKNFYTFFILDIEKISVQKSASGSQKFLANPLNQYSQKTPSAIYVLALSTEI